jgi:hypothetical protein
MHLEKLVAGATCAAAMSILAANTQGFSTFATWPSTQVVFYANPANLDVSQTAAENAFKSGLNVWNTQARSNFRYVYGGRVTSTSTGYDGRNVVLFRNASSGSALATTYSWWSGSNLVDSDIVVWDGAFRFFTGTSGCSNGAYLEDVLTHELGHALGLNHSTDLAATMYPSYTLCSTSLRSLAGDDIAGAQSLYGVSTATAPMSTPAAKLSARGYRYGTGWKVELAWSGFTSHSVDVFKNGRRYTTTINDGATRYTLTTGGTLVWKLCAMGSTSICSNDVTVKLQ